VKKKIIFLINGLGLGNSTRCEALINILKKKYDIYLVLSGNSEWYFKKKYKNKHICIQSINYKSKNNKINIFNTLLEIVKKKNVLVSNSEKIIKFSNKIKPDIIISDSVYINFYKLNKKIRLISLNNAELVIKKFFKLKNFKFSILFHFLFIEFFDFLISKFFFDNNLSPILNFNDLKVSNKKLKRIPIISKFKEKSIKEYQNKKLSIMLSGSSFSSNLNLSKKLNIFKKINIIGNNKNININRLKNVEIHGKIRNNLIFLDQSDFVIINCGYSAIADSITLKKPMLMLPIKNHAEQWINAKEIEKMGLGKIVNKDLSNEIIEFMKNLNKYTKNFKKLKYPKIKKYVEEIF
tara:strand:- start:4363 stop:5415 length:1053 start_codon:yes stop_codon:yes gene_type:complete